MIEVSYRTHMGSDLTIVNAARVSFGKHKDVFDEQDAKLIKYLASHGHWCYDDMTEIFTSTGWKLFKNMDSSDLVAQVFPEKETMEFVQPSKIHKSFYSGHMYGCTSKNIDYLVTPGHKFIVQKRNQKGYKSSEIEVSENLHNKTFRIPKTAKLKQNGDGSFLEGWGYGFLVGDGHRENNTSVSVHLKSKRKIMLIKNALSELNVEFHEKKSKEGCTIIRWKDSFSYVPTTRQKNLQTVWNNSCEYLNGVFIGLMDSNGSKKNNSWSFRTSSPYLMNDIMKLSILCGYSTSSPLVRKAEKPTHGDCYSIIIHSRKIATTRNAKFYVSNYSGFVYCVTVPSGFVLIRRNGKQIVSGNTPFAHVQVQLHFKTPIFIARQLVKHQAGLVWNEVSRRYVSYDPEYYYPHWKYKPVKKKQGSGDLLPPKELDYCNHVYEKAIAHTDQCYKELLEHGVAPEQARAILPLASLTEWIWTGSLYAFARVYNLRIHDDAQSETREVARQIDSVIRPLFPVAWPLLTERHQGNREPH